MRMSAVIVVVAALLVANADAWSRWVKTAAAVCVCVLCVCVCVCGFSFFKV